MLWITENFLIHGNECLTGVEARSALTLTDQDSALSTLIKLACLWAKLKKNSC
jgi:hypothetical protein